MAERDGIDQRLAIARAALTPPAAAKYRVRASITPAAPQAPRASRVLARAHGVSKLVTAGLVGLGFLAGYWLGWQRSTAPHELPSPSAAVVADATRGAAAATDPGAPNGAVPLGAAPSAAPEAPPSPTPADGSAAPGAARDPAANDPTASERSLEAASTGGPVAPRRRPATRATHPNDDAYAAELALLTRAERAIRAHEASLALTFLDELDRRFQSSRFVEERSAARVLAECELSVPTARARAELFLRSSASSVYSDRVRRSCQIDVAPHNTDGSVSTGH